MSRRVFFDTNVLVYMFDKSDPRKQKRARELVRRATDSGTATISYQVIQEFLTVALRKFKPPMPLLQAHTCLQDILLPMCEVFPSPALYVDALSVVGETGWTFYDSLIVSAAAAAGCAELMSEDLQHGRTVHGVEIKNPFL